MLRARKPLSELEHLVMEVVWLTPDCTAEVVRVRWQQVALDPGDFDRLESLRVAALADEVPVAAFVPTQVPLRHHQGGDNIQEEIAVRLAIVRHHAALRRAACTASSMLSGVATAA